MVSGLICLHEPEVGLFERADEQDFTIDIVAVHGFNEDSVAAWRDTQSKTLWLKDLLPQIIPQVRGLTFGYEASPSSFHGQNFGEKIQSHATTLVADLEANQDLEDCIQRPIIFVCHGAGGIIVKKALAHSASRTSNHITHLNSIYISTFAILFFGTPHSHIVCTSNEKFHIYFFWETVRTDFGNHEDFVVPSSSAAPVMDNTECAGIHATHEHMVKLSESNRSYRTVVAALRRYSQSAPNIIRQRWKQQAEDILRARSIEALEIAGISFDIPDKLPIHSLYSNITQVRAVNEHFMPPQLTSDHFIGRENACRSLEKAFLNDDNFPGLGQKRFVVHGLGGSGKTQLCSKFAKDQGHRYWAVFTIDASSQDRAAESFARIGEIGGMQSTEQAGKYFLQQAQKPWLLIIDNADKPDLDIEKLFPSADKGHLLVTTRNPDLRKYGNVGSLELLGLSEEDALHLLLKSAWIARPWDTSMEVAGKRITKALGYLTLAIIQAGNSIYRKLCKLEDYLGFHQRYQRKRQAGDNTTSNLRMTTYTQLLNFPSNTLLFYHFDRIRIDMFIRAIKNMHTTRMPSKAQSRLGALQNAAMRRFHPPQVLPSLLKDRADEDDIMEALHEPYSSSLINRIKMRERDIWGLAALNTLLSSFELPPADTSDADRKFRRDIVPHLSECISVHPIKIRQFNSQFEVWSAKIFQPSSLLLVKDQVINAGKCALVYGEIGSFSQAAEYLEMVKDTLVQLRGYNDAKTTDVMLMLSELRWGLGQLKDAIELQHQVIESRSKAFGQNNRSTLQAMDKLGMSYWLNGQYNEALEQQITTTEKMKTELGELDNDTLSALDNLGVTLGSWRRYEESKDIHEKVLVARRRIQGENDLKTQVYSERSQQLGKEHPWTLWALCYLAKVYVELGLLQEAENILMGGIAAGKRSLPEDHLGILMGCGELARTYARQGLLEESEKLTLDTVSKIKVSRGHAHYDYVFAMWKLGHLYELQKKPDEALTLADMEEGGRQRGVAAAFPPPPPFWRHFTVAKQEKLRKLKNEADDSIKAKDQTLTSLRSLDISPELRYLVPPEPPTTEYTLFGEKQQLSPTPPSLEEQGIEQLYPSALNAGSQPPPPGQQDQQPLSHAYYLTKISKSLLLNFLEFVGVLSICPEQHEPKLEDIRNLFINAHHLLNLYRPHQARESLILMLENQLNESKAEIEEMDRMKSKLEAFLVGLKSEGQTALHSISSPVPELDDNSSDADQLAQEIESSHSMWKLLDKISDS
ncbi:hypothetical protein FQN57_000514 [Myotisia sp. PD_48]|nr:hypothetical protein FQN57_000514 [Myotisia sp. PD_48]